MFCDHDYVHDVFLTMTSDSSFYYNTVKPMFPALAAEQPAEVLHDLWYALAISAFRQFINKTRTNTHRFLTDVRTSERNEMMEIMKEHYQEHVDAYREENIAQT